MTKKIVFLSILSPFDISNWSGTLYYIFKVLSKKNRSSGLEKIF